MHRYDENAIRRLLIAVEQDHPWSDDESSRRPPSFKLRTRQGEGFEDPQRARDTIPSVVWKSKSGNRFVDVPPRLWGDDDLRHSGSQIVERRSFAAGRLSEAPLSPLPGTWDRI